MYADDNGLVMTELTDYTVIHNVTPAGVWY